MSLHKQAELESLQEMIKSLAGLLGDKDSLYGPDAGIPVDSEEDEIPAEDSDLGEPDLSVISLKAEPTEEDIEPDADDLGLGNTLPTEELDTEEDPDMLQKLIKARLSR